MDELFEGWIQDVRDDLIEKFHAGALDIPALVQEYNDNVQDLWDSERAGHNEEDLGGKGGIEMKKGNYMETITRKCECGATVEVDARLIGMIDEESFSCDKCNKEMKHKLDEKKQAEENGEQVFI